MPEKQHSKLDDFLEGVKENRKIEKGKETITGKIDRRKFNRGFPGSGRKKKEVNLITRGIKEYVDQHINEEVEVQIVDKKTGKTITIKKPRVAAALEKLYQIGMRGDGSSDALNKWLDRSLGRPIQVVGGDEDKPIRLLIDF